MMTYLVFRGDRKMKQRISKDLVMRRYLELIASGFTRKEATYWIGKMLLKFYEIAWSDTPIQRLKTKDLWFV